MDQDVGLEDAAVRAEALLDSWSVSRPVIFGPSAEVVASLSQLLARSSHVSSVNTLHCSYTS